MKGIFEKLISEGLKRALVCRVSQLTTLTNLGHPGFLHAAAGFQ